MKKQMSQPPEGNTADSPRDDHADDRLARLERAVVDLSARLRGIEHLLDVSAQKQTATRPFGQGTHATQTRARAGGESARALNEPTTTPAPSRDATPRATPGAFTGEVDAAASDESDAVEDYPFAVPPTLAPEESEEQPPFASESSTYRPFASSAQFAESEEKRITGERSRVDDGAAAGSSLPRARRDLETLIGGKWLPWVAMIALTVGVGLFLKLAFDNQWIGAGARVLLGAAAGCALLALAEFLHARGYRPYAHVLTGGGILILYLSVYAARVFYDLVGVTAAFALMGVVTATAVLLAVRRDARSIAVLGLVGGFATPILLRTGVDRQIGLFSYVAFLDAGVLALAYFKRWRVLNHLAYASTGVLFVGWAISYYEPWKEWRTFFFLTLFFMMFSALAVLHNVLRQRPARWLDISLIISNATLYFAASYAVLYERHESLLAALALALAILYSLLYYTAHARHREDRLLPLAYVGAAITFLTIAIAVRFDQHWVTIGWAMEGLALTWLGLRTGERAPRYFALAVFTFAVEHWFVFDLREFAPLFGASFVPLLNTRAVSCAAIVGALAGSFHLYRRRAEGIDKEERGIIAGALTLAANALVLTQLTADVVDYFDAAVAVASAVSGDQMTAHVQSIQNSSHLTLTLLWTVYAAAAVAFGLRRNVKLLRYAGLAWLAATGIKILSRDAGFYDAAWHAPLFNQTFAAFVVFVAACWCVAHLYARAGEEVIGADERREAMASLAVVGNLFAVAALSLEASGYFRKQLAERAAAGANTRDLRLAQQLSLSLVWMVYGGATLLFGHVRQNKTLRVFALALLAATTVKVFFFDLSGLEKLYRIISFIVLGLVLLAVSFLYQQRQRGAKETEG